MWHLASTVGLLLAAELTLLGPPVWAQAPTPGAGATTAQAPAQPQPYFLQLLGFQPPSVAPGQVLAPPVPPAPSQSHVPRDVAFIAPPTVPTVPRAMFDFRPTLGFSEQYTDNFNLSAQDKVSDFRSTITPGLSLLVNAPRTQGTVSASLGIAQDSVNSFGDFSIFSNLSASVQHVVNPRLTLYLVDTLVRSDQPSLAGEFGLRQERQTFTSNSLSLSADWLLDLVAVQGYYQLSTFFSDSNTTSNILGVNAGIPLGALMAVRGGYEFSYSQTSGTTSGESTGQTSGTTSGESTGNLVWASLVRQLNPLATVGISGTYSLQSLDSSRIWNVSLFNTYELPGRLSLSGSVGYSMLTSDASGTFSTVSTNTKVTYRFAKAVISVGLFQDLVPTFTQGENFGITLTRSYTGSLMYAWTPFIDTTLRATYSQNGLTGVGDTSGNQNTFSAGASLGWRIRPWLTMTLDYTYNRYDSDTSSAGASAGGSVTENRVALGLTASF